MAWDIWGSHQAHKSLVDRQMATLADAAAAGVAGNVRAIDQLLQDAAKTADITAWPDGALIRHVQDRLAAYPEIRHLLIVDPMGRAVAAIQANGAGKADFDVQDRDYFRYQREHWREPALYVAAPLISLNSHQPVIAFTRPLPPRDGHFGGLVVAGVNPLHFNAVLEALATGREASAALLRRDGLFLARYPDAPGYIGLSVAASPIFARYLPESPSGVTTLPDLVDGRERIVAYRAISGYPLVAVATVLADEAFREWRRRALSGAAIILLLAVAVLAFAGMVERRNTRLKHLAEIIHSSDDAIVSKTLDGIVTSWNDGAERLFGYPAQEILGRPIAILLPEERLAEEKELLARLAAGQAVEHFETRRRCRDGRLIDVSVSISLVRDGRGRITGASKIARDISARKRAEAELVRLNADLEHQVEERTAELVAANQEMESFTYAVSHDLRGPLRAMSGFSQALLEDLGPRLDGEARLYLDQIVIASHHMGALIDGLLLLSRCTRGELVRDRVDLTAMAVTLREELQRAHPERRVLWHIDAGMVAWADPRMLEIVMRNLMGNALKYSAHKEVADIRVAMKQKDGQACYWVSDNGAGFDPAHAGKLFKPFQRLHRQDEFRGLGIGLATVRRIILRHGGRITAESVLGQGATFRFSLPPAGAQHGEMEEG